MQSFFERYLNRHILLEIAPGVIFYAVNVKWGLFAATAAVIASTIVVTILGIAFEKRVPMFPLITVLLVAALGGATLLFSDESFIKVMPTVAKCLFAAGLTAGLFLRPTLLARALEGQLYLSNKGWRVLTLRWVAFALLMALANEVVWRTQDTDTWVTFKAMLTPVSIFVYILITRATAPTYWQEPAKKTESDD